MFKISIIRGFLLMFIIVFVSVCGMYGYYYFTQETEILSDETRKGLNGQFIKLSKGYVHYELAGPDSGNSVILIHGAGSGYYAWDKNFYVLASKGYKVLRYDLYGRGFSDRPDLVYDPDLFEQQLSELIDSLKIRRPFTIVSVSMGAIIAVKHTVSHPASVGNLIMIDPAALNDPKKPFTLRTPVISDLLMMAYWYPRAIEKQMREFYRPDKITEYAFASVAQMKYKGFKRAMKSTWLNTLNKNSSDELNQIGNLGNRVLLLWGRYDPLIPPIVSKDYKKHMPQTEYYEIDNAGHLANYEQPDVVNNIIIRFLKKGR